MKKRFYADTFKATETLQNGKERTCLRTVYSDCFTADGRNNGFQNRISKAIGVLANEHLYNIEYVKSASVTMLFT